ncbi:hypothetical protein EYF80_034752 [Liparis tanakae]|uniref:Uncharacterized protein n=1 Tax=Liparis tanakae TaxID=230148 RepID=A0A4Z2GNF2_9TELE|nr:hypothetical protein EYF80_034752 [Liparis tanakae]
MEPTSRRKSCQLCFHTSLQGQHPNHQKAEQGLEKVAVQAGRLSLAPSPPQALLTHHYSEGQGMDSFTSSSSGRTALASPASAKKGKAGEEGK